MIRQGHPGPQAREYSSYEQKRSDAQAHQAEDGIPWTVLVDDVQGSVHRAYGMLADPTFLLDRDGRVAFYNAVTHAPTLDVAIEQLMELGGLGVAGSGYDRRVHALPVIAGGWPGLRRGLPQSAIDLELAMPGGALVPFLGYQLRGVLAPVAQRGTRLPASAQVGAGLLAGGLFGYVAARSLAGRAATG